MTKQDLIEKIVSIEWEMFQDVRNLGGTAPCQENEREFRIQRTSQAVAWPERVMESYLDDLDDAKRSGRNLLSEKYAWMMETTFPEQFAEVRHLLPVLGQEMVDLIDRIVAIALPWAEELRVKFPNLMQSGRPIHRREDSRFVTSMETYLRGELATYSLRTLNLVLENMHRQKSDRINGTEIVMENSMKMYGFPSLEAAERRLQR